MKVLQNGKFVPNIMPGLCFENIQEAYNPECLVPTETWRQICGDLSSNILLFCWSVYSEWLNYCQ
jgi:hypothetical protein